MTIVIIVKMINKHADFGKNNLLAFDFSGWLIYKDALNALRQLEQE